MSRSAAPTLAALAAICFWSLTPVFVTIIGDRLNSGEIFVLAAIAGGAVSLVVALIDGPLRRTIFSAAVRRFMVPAAISGAFLGLWYYGFYRALQETGKIEATVVAFTWPMIALIALPLLSRRPLHLGPGRWALIVVGLAGAALAAVAPGSEIVGGSGLIWAALAALGSGFYLPFAVRAAERMPDSLGPVRSTFASISVANVSALLCVLVFRLIAGDPVGVPHALGSAGVVGLAMCAAIGIGVYIVAEVGWTWAMQTELAPRIGAIPYLSPVISVVLLALIFSAPVTAYAMVGLALVVGANVSLWIVGRAPREPAGQPASPGAPAAH